MEELIESFGKYMEQLEGISPQHAEFTCFIFADFMRHASLAMGRERDEYDQDMDDCFMEMYEITLSDKFVDAMDKQATELNLVIKATEIIRKK